MSFRADPFAASLSGMLPFSASESPMARDDAQRVSTLSTEQMPGQEQNRRAGTRRGGRPQRWALAVFGWLLCIPMAHAQDGPAKAPAVLKTLARLEGKTILAVKVEGAPDTATASSARALFGVTDGQPLDSNAIRLGIKRVFATGPWADVQVTAETVAGGVRLTLRLFPAVLVSDVQLLVTPPTVPTERLRGALTTAAGERYRERDALAAVPALETKLRELGYPRARVRLEAKANAANNERALLYFIDLGEPTILQRLTVVGEAPLTPADLRGLLGVREGAAFDRIRLEEGADEVEALLVSRGYFAASADILDARFDGAMEAASVRMRIDSGPKYTLRFRGNAVIETAYLKAQVPPGAVDNLRPETLEKLRRLVFDYYRDNGFALATVHIRDLTLPPKAGAEEDSLKAFERRRQLVFEIREGPRTKVAEITIEGAQALDAKQLVDDTWLLARTETPSPGLFQRVDVGDIDSALGTRAWDDDTPDAPELNDVRVGVYPVGGIYREPIYSKKIFEEAAQRIEDVYRAEGFLRVEIIGPEPIFLDGGKRVRVRYRIVEGTQVIVSGVRFTPDPPPIPRSAFLTASSVLPDQPANLYAIEETRVRFEKILREKGYPDAQVAETLKLKAPGQAEVVYAIASGPEVTLGQVFVDGNETTLTPVILDRVTFSPGDRYSASMIEQSRQRLLRMGIFSSVSIAFVAGDEDVVRDVVIRVRERNPLTVEFGGGISANDGPRLFTSAEVRNIFGIGLGLRGRAQVNNAYLLYDFLYGADNPANPKRFYTGEEYGFDVPELLSFPARVAYFTEGQFVGTAEIPRVWAIPFDLRIHTDIVGLREIRQSFTLLKTSGLVGAEATPSSWLRLGPQFEVELNDFNCPTDFTLGQGCGQANVNITRRQDAGTVRQATLRAFGAVDLRDDPFRPRRGFYASGTTSFALGDGQLRARTDDGGAVDVTVNYIKLNGVMSGYIPLGPGAVFAVSLRAGNIFNVGNPDTSYVPLFKRFYLGGTGSIRGFNQDEVIPADNTEWQANWLKPRARSANLLEARNSLGGNFYLNGRSELRFALSESLELGIFVDGGQLFEDVANYYFGGFAVGAGAGFRWITPVGPVAFDFGTRVIDGNRFLPPLLDTTNGLAFVPRSNFHISIGTF